MRKGAEGKNGGKKKKKKKKIKSFLVATNVDARKGGQQQAIFHLDKQNKKT